MKQKTSTQQLMENEIKQLELNEQRKAREEADPEEVQEEKEAKEPPFRNLVTFEICGCWPWNFFLIPFLPPT